MNTAKIEIKEIDYKSVDLPSIINNLFLECKIKNIKMSFRKMAESIGVPKSTINDIANRKREISLGKDKILGLLSLTHPSLSVDEIINTYSSNVHFGQLLQVDHKNNPSLSTQTHGNEKFEKYLGTPSTSEIVLTILDPNGIDLAFYKDCYGTFGLNILNDMIEEGSFYIKKDRIFPSNLLIAGKPTLLELSKCLIDKVSKQRNPQHNNNWITIQARRINLSKASPKITKILSECQREIDKVAKEFAGEDLFQVTLFSSQINSDLVHKKERGKWLH